MNLNAIFLWALLSLGLPNLAQAATASAPDLPSHSASTAPNDQGAPKAPQETKRPTKTPQAPAKKAPTQAPSKVTFHVDGMKKTKSGAT